MLFVIPSSIYYLHILFWYYLLLFHYTLHDIITSPFPSFPSPSSSFTYFIFSYYYIFLIFITLIIIAIMPYTIYCFADIFRPPSFVILDAIISLAPCHYFSRQRYYADILYAITRCLRCWYYYRLISCLHIIILCYDIHYYYIIDIISYIIFSLFILFFAIILLFTMPFFR